MSKDRLLNHLALGQGGFVRRDQVHELGFSDRQIAYRVNNGLWVRIGRVGYRVFDIEGPDARIQAAVAALPDAVVSHESAAEVHRLSRLRKGQAVVSVHSRTTHEFPDVIVRRTHDLEKTHICEMKGLPTTTAARTIVDMAAFLHPQHLGAIVDDAVVEGLVTLESIEAVATAVCRRGRPGSANVRDVLASRTDGVWVPATVLERRGRQLLERYGLPRPVPQFPIPWAPYNFFDDAYPWCCLALEWDSWRWHSQVERMQRDRQRDRECAAHGWNILRITWFDITKRPDALIDEIRRALAAAESRAKGNGQT